MKIHGQIYIDERYEHISKNRRNSIPKLSKLGGVELSNGMSRKKTWTWRVFFLYGTRKAEKEFTASCYETLAAGIPRTPKNERVMCFTIQVWTSELAFCDVSWRAAN